MNKKISKIYNVTVQNSSIVDIEKNKATARTTIPFSSADRQSGIIMHTNYPEFISDNSGYAFAEKGYCTNQKTYGPGYVQVFFSHHNKNRTPFWYGIHVFNPNSESVNVKILNWGFSTGFENTLSPVYQCFDTTQQSKSIERNGNWWVLEQQIPAAPSGGYTPFWGIVRLYVSKPVIITTYAFKDKSSLKGTEVPYPRSLNYSDDIQVHSGYGDGYCLKKTIDLKVSSLQNKDSWYFTGEHGAWGRNSGELTPIHLVGENLIATPESSDDNLNQLGNWTTQYDFTVNITNDTASPKTIYGFISGNSGNSNPVIKTDNYISGWSDLKETTVRWFQETIPANTTYTYKYTYMQASYGCPSTQHAWSLSSEL